jgi:Mor family transcriptional regulator
MFDNDIVRDILRRAVEAAQHSEGGFTDSLARQIESQVRKDWGGTEPYIAHDVEHRRIERNEKIVQLWDAGNKDVKRLACRFGLSEKQVRRILGG